MHRLYQKSQKLPFLGVVKPCIRTEFCIIKTILKDIIWIDTLQVTKTLLYGK